MYIKAAHPAVSTGALAVAVARRRGLRDELVPAVIRNRDETKANPGGSGVCFEARSTHVLPPNPLPGPALSSEGMDLMNDPVIQRVAQKYNKSPAQILLRFQIQRNVIVIPKSVNPKRILENIQVFDFELSEQDMNDIFGLDRNFRMCRLPIAVNHKDYPFNIDY